MTRGHAGQWWDAANGARRDVRRAQRLLRDMSLGLGTEDATSLRAAAEAVDYLLMLHGLGRPVCAGDVPSEMTISIRLDPCPGAVCPEGEGGEDE